MRTIIEVPDEVVASLDKLGREGGLSRAALIREAISQYLAERGRSDSEAFGIWRTDPVDGVQYQEKVRGEWS